MDDSGALVPYATSNSTLIQSSSTKNYLKIDLAGVKMWSWVANPITLHWNVVLNDGTIKNDLLVVTVQGVSDCESSFYPTYAVVPK